MVLWFSGMNDISISPCRLNLLFGAASQIRRLYVPSARTGATAEGMTESDQPGVTYAVVAGPADFGGSDEPMSNEVRKACRQPCMPLQGHPVRPLLMTPNVSTAFSKSAGHGPRNGSAPKGRLFSDGGALTASHRPSDEARPNGRTCWQGGEATLPWTRRETGKPR